MLLWLFLLNGKTTDLLLKEAYELAKVPNDRELDVLLSSGEQISISKLSILLNNLGYPSVSLTGLQAGIFTNNTNQNAIIDSIDTTRILGELKQRKIVIVAGFQGYNENLDITTLGRGGSDTTAVALAASLNASHCYIFSDVDGVYTADPNKYPEAKKLGALSYVEMLNIANEGAKVLHNRCVEIGEKFSIPIITKSTFNNKSGTVITDKIEDSVVKSIVKNDNLILVNLKYENYSAKLFYQVYDLLVKSNILPIQLNNNSVSGLDIDFVISSNFLNKLQLLLNDELNMFTMSFRNVSRIAVVGYGITNNGFVLNKVLRIAQMLNLDVYNIDLTNAKIIFTFKEKVQNNFVELLHNELFN
jgi:aspartate kinase